MARRRTRPPGGFDPLPLAPQPPDPLLAPEEVSEWLKVSRRTLMGWRNKGSGPMAERLGNRLIMYRTSAVEAWLGRLWEQAPF